MLILTSSQVPHNRHNHQNDRGEDGQAQEDVEEEAADYKDDVESQQHEDCTDQEAKYTHWARFPGGP